MTSADQSSSLQETSQSGPPPTPMLVLFSSLYAHFHLLILSFPCIYDNNPCLFSPFAVVTLLDYGAGNVRSVRNAIRYLGFEIKDVGFFNFLRL